MPARLGIPIACPWAFLHPSIEVMLLSASASVPTRAKSCWQAWITSLSETLGFSWASIASTWTWRPARPPLALTMSAHALTTLSDFWNRPGLAGAFTSAITATRMVVAVSPMSVPGAAEPAGEAAPVPAGADDADEAGALGAGELLLEDEQPAAVASAIAITAPATQDGRRLTAPPAPRERL